MPQNGVELLLGDGPSKACSGVSGRSRGWVPWRHLSLEEELGGDGLYAAAPLEELRDGSPGPGPPGAVSLLVA